MIDEIRDKMGVNSVGFIVGADPLLLFSTARHPVGWKTNLNREEVVKVLVELVIRTNNKIISYKILMYVDL